MRRDIYLFYPPTAVWTDAGLPPPEKVIVQAMGVVIGAKGTLPPKGDRTRVPKWADGRADVVGEQRGVGRVAERDRSAVRSRNTEPL